MYSEELVWFTNEMIELRGIEAERYLENENIRLIQIRDRASAELHRLANEVMIEETDCIANRVMNIGENLSELKLQLELFLDELREF